MAIPDVVEACKEADIIIFVLPHKFVKPTCTPLVGKIKNTAVGLSLIKGNWLLSFSVGYLRVIVGHPHVKNQLL